MHHASAIATKLHIPWSRRAGQPVARTERVFYPAGFRYPMHGHDFAELFLVEQGQGTHRVGSRSFPVAAGDLVLVHPDLEHGLQAHDDQPLLFTNLAVAMPVFRHLEARYGGDVWPWSCREAPVALRLHGPELDAVAKRLDRLEVGAFSGDLLAIESLLLDVLSLARERLHPRPRLPEPLARALGQLDRPEHLRGGVAALARLAGWSREHLNRQVRRHLGISASELLMRHRLDLAARLLRHSQRTVPDICALCGLTSLSHFYAVFRARFGCTPARLREPGAGAPA